MKPEDPLLDAIFEKKSDVVDSWIKKGNNVTQSIENWQINLLFYALYTGFEPTIELLVAAGAKLDTTFRGHSAYWVPIQQNNLSVVKLLFRLGLDVNIRDFEGDTPLHYALALKRVKIASFLQEHGADLLTVNDAQISPSAIVNFRSTKAPIEFNSSNLQLALYNGKPEIFRQWVKRGNDLTPYQTECLCRALLYGNVKLFEYFVSLGFDLHTKTESPETLLHFAVFGGRITSVRRLLDAGIPLNDLDYASTTPLFVAEETQFDKIFNLILSAIKPPAEKWEGFTAKMVTDTVKSLMNQQNDFEKLYRSIARQRQQYQMNKEPFDRHSHYFGHFCNRLTKQANEIFYEENVNYFHASSSILDWLSSMIKAFEERSDFISPCLKIQPLDKKPAELLRVCPERRARVRDSYTSIHELKIVYKLENELEIELKFYFFQYEGAKPIAIMIYPYNKQVNLESICFKTADNMFKKALIQQSPDNLLRQIGYFMHFMALMIPVKRGNAGIVEILAQSLATFKGYEIRQLNQPLDILRWDLKAFITPEPEQYAQWFEQTYYPMLSSIESKTPKSIPVLSFFESGKKKAEDTESQKKARMDP